MFHQGHLCYTMDILMEYVLIKKKRKKKMKEMPVRWMKGAQLFVGLQMYRMMRMGKSLQRQESMNKLKQHLVEYHEI
uniref:Uncharacterized protein n=1 Tax=Magallana gigas TaxID=29159 RepID=K1P7Q5_MAGGI